jgi:hypothetical protein
MLPSPETLILIVHHDYELPSSLTTQQDSINVQWLFNSGVHSSRDLEPFTSGTALTILSKVHSFTLVTVKYMSIQEIKCKHYV